MCFSDNYFKLAMQMSFFILLLEILGKGRESGFSLGIVPADFPPDSHLGHSSKSVAFDASHGR